VAGAGATGTEAAIGGFITGGAARFLAVFRVVLGLEFLWAFVDKSFGLGYATPSARAWIHGGSPTKGFLSNVAVGPLEGTFHAWAGAWWADGLFMVGLAGIGIALVLGIGLRIAAVSGTQMLMGMWAAEWPLARFTSAGAPSMSTNPLVDYHLIYALALIVLALAYAGHRWGPSVGEAVAGAALPLADLTPRPGAVGGHQHPERAGGH
jgi:thiosulfate dehydrogenase [quinone] large subunit